MTNERKGNISLQPDSIILLIEKSLSEYSKMTNEDLKSFKKNEITNTAKVNNMIDEN